MSQTRHERVKAVFFAVSESPAEDREAVLNRECGDDAVLRREVESLLDHAEAPGVDLDDAGSKLREMIMSATRGKPMTLERLGEYRILGVLGEGGMGVVYLAEQDKPRRTVALKVIRAGMVTPGLLRRFEHETQVLGRLQHPGIAPIFDAGAADSGFGLQPYFAMEYIRGRPLTDHADTHRFGTRERLRLIVKVAQAVQYAHQNGVIHRDLKPSNVLVDEHGQPRILDFGVARSTDADTPATTMRTDVGQLIGTVPYMSPEQVAGDSTKVDSRSDVYALGVMMYELLCGRLPYDLKDKPIPEAVRIIGQQDHTRLSSINKVFRGDLDTIVAKSLEKDPIRRYQSAAELALDIQRYLDDEPIVARPASTFYQLRKFAKRNRAAVAAIAAIFATLVAASIISVVYAVRASEARDDAVAAKLEETRLRGVAEEQRQAAEDRTKEALWQAYLANIVAADAALGANDIPTARRRLLLVPQEMRGNWEWRFLFNRLDYTYTYFGLGASALYRIRFTDDGAKALVSTWGKSIHVLDASTWKTLLVLSGHTSRVFALDVTGDGRLAASGSDDSTIRIWDLSTGSTRQELSGTVGPVLTVAFSPDGSLLASGGDEQEIRLWNVQTGEPMGELAGHTSGITSLRFSKDGSTLYSCSQDHTIRWWSIPERRCTRCVVAHTANIRNMDLSPDGTKLLSCGEDGYAKLWSASTGELLQTFRGHVGPVRCGTFSPAGDVIVTGGKDATIRLWDPATGEPKGILRGHPVDVYDVAFQPDGQFIASSCMDGNLRLWDPAAAGGVDELRGHTGGVQSFVFSWDGSCLISAGMDATLRTWDAASGIEVDRSTTRKADAQPIAISPDGMVLALGADTEIEFRDASTLDLIGSMPAHARSVKGIEFSRDGSRLVSSGMDGFVHVIDVGERRILRTFNAGGTIPLSAIPMQDGEHLLVLWNARRLSMYDMNDGAVAWERELESKALVTAAISADGSLVAYGSGGGEVRLIRAENGEAAGATLKCAVAVTRLAFSPDGKRLAVGNNDGTIRLWDLETREEVLVLREHLYQITCLEWSPDGERLASSSFEHSIRLWETSRMAVRLRAKHEAKAKMLPVEP